MSCTFTSALVQGQHDHRLHQNIADPNRVKMLTASTTLLVQIGPRCCMLICDPCRRLTCDLENADHSANVNVIQVLLTETGMKVCLAQRDALEWLGEGQTVCRDGQSDDLYVLSAA